VAEVTETFSLQAFNGKGVARAVGIELRDPRESAIDVVIDGGPAREFRANNLFVCLIDARLCLEEDGFLLCCQGARPNVFPSGMLQQEANGRYAYVLSEGTAVDGRPVVDIFAPAELDEVATVAVQRTTVMDLFGLGGRL
jgi:hypothetical protein